MPGKNRQDNNGSDFEGWLVTNTHFTTDAIDYGNCIGLKLMGWNYPKKGSLKEQVDISGLYPITVLSSLSRKERKILLSNMVVLCREISRKPQVLTEANISPDRHDAIMEEVTGICPI